MQPAPVIRAADGKLDAWAARMHDEELVAYSACLELWQAEDVSPGWWHLVEAKLAEVRAAHAALEAAAYRRDLKIVARAIGPGLRALAFMAPPRSALEEIRARLEDT